MIGRVPGALDDVLPLLLLIPCALRLCGAAEVPLFRIGDKAHDEGPALFSMTRRSLRWNAAILFCVGEKRLFGCFASITLSCKCDAASPDRHRLRMAHVSLLD